MIEPHFWNPLPAAAAWLSTETGRSVTTRDLIDFVVRTTRQRDCMKTVIKAVFPREAQFAKLRMRGFGGIAHPDNRELHKSMASKFGEPLGGMSYIGLEYLTVAPLTAGELQQLLIYEAVHLSVVSVTDDGVSVWLMPWDAAHVATLETCGVNDQDLLALSRQFVAKYQLLAPIELAGPKPPAAPAFAAVASTEKIAVTVKLRDPTPHEVTAARQASRYDCCVATGLVFSPNSLHPMPRGIGKMATELRISRQSLTADLVKHIERLQSQSN